ncbi:BRO1-domain-containing protein [Lichtheimia hyalospora FSU 10163]|nr:BRO1-domain-containing protein [Lichtheimia hyalospora FSU 10163]
MAQLQIPFISVPPKRTQDVDWIYPLKHYIAHVYQEDPEKYNEEAHMLNRLRQDTRGAGKDNTGRDLLYRYFGQLELLDLRFPVDEKNVKVLFNWYDAFNGRPTAQYSLAYEKASIIFNIAATLSAIAAIQNRGEAEGRKKAFNYFQAAAGMFQYINDNFLHAPSQDLSRETVKVLTELMLAQAHECFLESSVREKKKDGLVAKLASHTVWVYGNVVDELQDAVSRGAGIDKSWITLCQIKHKYYQSLAQLHKAATCEAESHYGEQVARLKAGEASAKEASGKLCTSLISQVQSSGNNVDGTLPADSGTVMQEMTKTLAATCEEKCTAATRDNDMIYHDNVPQESILTPIDRLKAVKPTPISDLYGPNDISKVIGPDIFAKLVPLSVHESASMYSEEKAKLLRGESERCDLAKAELQTALDYMKLPGSLDKFTRQQDQSVDDLMVPTKETKQWADDIASDDTRTSIQELMETLEGFKRHASQKLDQATFGLDKEMHECESMRVKYGDQWTQQPSSQITSDFRRDIKNHRTTLQTAAQSDGDILQRYEGVKEDIAVLKQGGKSAALEKVFSDGTSLAFDQDSKKSDAQSLLDLDMPTSNQGGQDSLNDKVNKVEHALDKLRRIESERNETLQDLREKSLDDDISNVLILNKKAPNVEQQIFASELEKYESHRQRITVTIQRQQQAIRELTDAYKSLMEDKEASTLQTRYDRIQAQQRKVVDRFRNAKDRYFNVKEDLTKGIQFYSNACDVIDTLYDNIQRFLRERSNERERLSEQLQNHQTAREQEMLKEKLQSYGSAPPAPTASISQGTTDNNVSRLIEQARTMSLSDPNSTPSSYSNMPISTQSYASPLHNNSGIGSTVPMYNPAFQQQPTTSAPPPSTGYGYSGPPPLQQQPPLPPKPTSSSQQTSTTGTYSMLSAPYHHTPTSMQPTSNQMAPPVPPSPSPYGNMPAQQQQQFGNAYPPMSVGVANCGPDQYYATAPPPPPPQQQQPYQPYSTPMSSHPPPPPSGGGAQAPLSQYPTFGMQYQQQQPPAHYSQQPPTPQQQQQQPSANNPPYWQGSSSGSLLD